MVFFNEVHFIRPEEQQQQQGEEQGEEQENQRQQQQVPQNVLTIKATSGDDFQMEPIDLSRNIVRVRCDCLDFYFRFAPWDFSNNDLFGPKPKPYVRKTTTRPSVNPTRSPGVCKHIMKLVLGLRDAGMLRR